MRVIALVGQERFGSIGKLKMITEFIHPADETAQLYVDNLHEVFALQSLEHHHIVNTIEELRRENAAQSFVDDAVSLL